MFGGLLNPFLKNMKIEIETLTVMRSLIKLDNDKIET